MALTQKMVLTRAAALLLMLAVLSSLAQNARAIVAQPVLSTVYAFSALDASYNNPDGANSVAPLALGPDGALYGTTADGGTAGAGTLFKVSPKGTGFTTLYSFGNAADGGYPLAGLTVGTGGFLYGTTSDGGTGAAGTVFKIKADGTGFSVLHAFQAASDGAYPSAGLTLGTDGFLYGTTSGGYVGTGTVFKIKADGTGFTTLHSFAPGEEPLSSVISGGDGFWYGTTMAGGSGQAGTIFKVSSDGTSFTSLYSLAGDTVSGGYPAAGLTLGKDGFLYGTTSDNQVPGASGTVFKINLDGSGFTTLYRFTGGDDGSTPLAPLVQGADGTLYGTAFSGGSSSGDGTVFKLQGDGSGFTVLASLTGSGSEGSGPSSSLTTGTGGQLYGTSSGGGITSASDAYGAGAVFAINLGSETTTTGGGNTPPTPTLTPRTHVLWTNTTGVASLWNYDTATGGYVTREYGPFPGWTAKSIADGPDGKTRVLWLHTSGQVSLWSLDAVTAVYSNHEYGPFPGWSAQGISIGADNTTHVLWTHTNGQLSLWNYNTATGGYVTREYGPFPGWTAKSIADGPDDKTRVLWLHTSGQVSLWSLDAATAVYSNHEYGPFPGWSAQGISAAP